MTFLLTLAVLASFALIGGGAWQLSRRPGDRRRAWLMIAAGAVTLFNVWSWSTLPGAG